MNTKCLFLVKLIFCYLLIIFYCEFVHYYLVLSQCDWPQIKISSSSSNTVTPVKFMILTDTHLMGPKRSVWIDRVLRDWEMYRAFQTAVNLHKPEIVFFLGDLTDEGEITPRRQFPKYRERFQSMFAVPEGTRIYTTVGNHDIGFHVNVQKDSMEKFIKAFDSNGTQLIEVRGIYFVLLNSVALEGDNCFFCKPVEKELLRLEKLLDCYSDQAHCSPHITRKKYSRPILLQHFPLYRKSDENCTEPDEAPFPEKIVHYKEKYDCLGKNATMQLMRQIKPRLAVSGHTHHGCQRPLPSNNGIEITLPSFNWRHKIKPSYGLFVATPDEYAFYKCLMPVETTVFTIYIIGFLFIPLWLYYLQSKQFRKRIYGCVCKCFTSRYVVAVGSQYSVS